MNAGTDIVCCRECGEPLRDGQCSAGHSQAEPPPPREPSSWETFAARLLAPETEAAGAELLGLVCPEGPAELASEEGRAAVVGRAMSPAGRVAQKKLLRALLGRSSGEG